MGIVLGAADVPGTSDQLCEILYIKASLVENMPWDVRSFAERTRDFLNQSTFDQVLEDEQFEAYRALGYHLAGRALSGGRETSSVAPA